MRSSIAHQRNHQNIAPRMWDIVTLGILGSMMLSGCSAAPAGTPASPVASVEATATPPGLGFEIPLIQPSGTPAGAGGPGEPPHVIQDFSIRGRTFTPAAVSVPVGAIGLWSNNSEETHLIAGPGWQLGPIGPGQAWAHTFKAEELGTVTYRCTIHPEMTGQATVTPPKS